LIMSVERLETSSSCALALNSSFPRRREFSHNRVCMPACAGMTHH
jgi:hypothetical protein